MEVRADFPMSTHLENSVMDQYVFSRVQFQSRSRGRVSKGATTYRMIDREELLDSRVRRR